MSKKKRSSKKSQVRTPREMSPEQKCQLEVAPEKFDRVTFVSNNNLEKSLQSCVSPVVRNVKVALPNAIYEGRMTIPANSIGTDIDPLVTARELTQKLSRRGNLIVKVQGTKNGRKIVREDLGENSKFIPDMAKILRMCDTLNILAK